MNKQTLVITHPAHLAVRQDQLIIYLKKSAQEAQRPIEDLALVLLAHREITLTHPLLSALAAKNVSLLVTNSSHLPNGLLFSLDYHCTQRERLDLQLNASLPMKKQLWKRVVQAKIDQQARLLQQMQCNTASHQLRRLARQVQSGDRTCLEAQAARIYWKNLLGPSFIRDREGAPPNQALNYGYTILRAATARALAAHGLFVMLGIHHKNRYNAFPLADDIMEPYRPFVDWTVAHLATPHAAELRKEDKIALLNSLTLDCYFSDKRTTLGTALEETAMSLVSALRENNAPALHFAALHGS